MVSMMTALWFAVLEAPDRVSVKPHASPVLHAINYLLGRLDREYLTTLRQFGGLQSYPSRTKDPDPVDYSTGSVGIGATAPVWGALAHRYVAGHFDVPVGGRQIALIGDAELDEGAIWEAIADPMVAKLGEVMWVVDLNRQSLDRVVPDIAAGRLAAMFEAAGWHVEMVKYGPRLQRLEALRARIDAMPNEEYQRLLRADAGELRERLEVGVLPGDDAELLAAFRDLGGHDLAALIAAFRAADAVRDRPSVVFAYTIKGWRLPTEGHPANHSALRARTSSSPTWPRRWAPIPPIRGRASTTARPRPSCARPRRRGCTASPSRRPSRRPCRRRSGASTAAARRRSRRSGASGSTSSARRRRSRSASSPCRRTSARPRTSAAGSTRPASGRSATGSTGSPTTPTRSCAGARATTASTSSWGSPRSTSSACSASSARRGRATGSRCCRSARSTTRSWRARSSRGRSGSTPAASRSSSARRAASRSGPEGGAHQSVITPSIGIEQPGCVAWEPAFGRDFEWTFLHALSRLGRPDGSSAYFRLSTRPLDQDLAGEPDREHVLAGGYRLREGSGVVIAAMGALVPEALEAAEELGRVGRLHHQRRPAVPRLPGALRPRRGRPVDPPTSCSRSRSRSSPCSTATRTR